MGIAERRSIKAKAVTAWLDDIQELVTWPVGMPVDPMERAFDVAPMKTIGVKADRCSSVVPDGTGAPDPTGRAPDPAAAAA